MKASRMRGMAVVSIEDAEKIGSVQDLILNPDEQRVVAIRVKSAEGREASIIPVDEIEAIGRDAITIRDTRGMATEIPMEIGTVYLSRLLGTKVLTRSGELLGTVAEVEMDGYDFGITGYELSTGVVSNVFGNRKRLPATDPVHFGKDILMVRDSQYERPEGSRHEEREFEEAVPPIQMEERPLTRDMDEDPMTESEQVSR